MKNLADLLGKDPIDGLFGVEVECEGRNLYPINNRYWKTEQDGSLRGVYPSEACEWVFKQPMSFDSSILALKHLVTAQEEAVFNFSFRTSVHVHVNVLDLTWDQYMAMIYLYMLLEEPMMRKCGKTRIANRFCLRVQDAEGILDTVEYMMQMGPPSLHAIHQETVKYSALNLAATPKYGSLEFRGMEGNLDIPRLTEWLTAIRSIKENAREFGNVKSVFRYVDLNGAHKLLEKVLGNAFFYDDCSNDILMSHSLTRDIPYMYKEEFVPVKEGVKKGEFRANVIGARRAAQLPAGWENVRIDELFAAQDANMAQMVRAFAARDPLNIPEGQIE